MSTATITAPVHPETRRKEAGPLDYISASRLKCWQTCRRQYFYRYVQRIEVPLAPALFIGRQVHEALSVWHRSRWRQEAIGPDELQAVFNQNWEEDQLDQDPAWKSHDEEEKQKQVSWALLEKYITECPIPADEKLQGVEVQVEADLARHGLPKLVGYIDVVRGNGRVVELKTAARSTNPAMLAHQHSTQLHCYALAYRAGTGSRETGFEIISLIKTKIAQVKVLTLDPMSAAQEAELYKLVEAYVKGVEHEEWIKSPGQHCSWCDFRDRCFNGKGGAA